jgi:hypothetical protein
MHFRIFARQLWPYFGFVFTLLLLNGCQQIPQTNESAVVLAKPVWETINPPTPLPTQLAIATVTALADGWESLRPGLAARNMPVMGNSGERLATLSILRLEPQAFRFAVGYIGESNQSLPLSLSEWQTRSQALLVVNGGYYRISETQQYLSNGLTIANGQVFGSSYVGFGGMLTIDSTGTPELRSLRLQPYQFGEKWQSALQSFPMLLTADGAPVAIDDTQIARRTVIAQDRMGNFLVMTTDNPVFTLTQLSAFLAQTDLELTIALNLDGGPSTGFVLNDPSIQIYRTTPASSVLPQVLLVYPR